MSIRKKLMALSLALTVLISALAIAPVWAGKSDATILTPDPLFSYTENFASYSSDLNPSTGSGVSLNSDWRSKTSEEGVMGTDGTNTNLAQFGLGDGSMQLMTQAGDTTFNPNTSVQDKIPALVYQGSANGVSPNQRIQLTAQKTHNSDAWGVRFMVHNQGQNYYFLWFGGQYTNRLGGGGKISWGLYKATNGTVEMLQQVDQSSNTADVEGGFMSNGIANLSLTHVDGQIDWSLDYAKGEKTFTWNSSYTDTKAFDTEGEDVTVWLCAAGNGTTGNNRYVKFDDITIEDNNHYFNGQEPKNVMYLNAAAGAAQLADEVLDLQNAYAVRKLVNAGAANTTADLYLSKDNVNWDVIRGITFDATGCWINNVTATAYRYVSLSGINAYRVYCDVPEDAAIDVAVKKNVELSPKIGSAQLSDITFTSGDDRIIAVDEDGIAKALRKGETLVTASTGETSLSITLNVIGEIELAQKNQTTAAYVAEKAPIVAAMNTAIKENDATALKTIFQNTGEKKIADIVDLDTEKITALDDEALETYINQLMTYQSFACEKVEDFLRLGEIIDAEYVVLQLNQAESATEVLNILKESKNYLTVKAIFEDAYYKQYQDAVLAKVANGTFDSEADFKDKFMDSCILVAFENALSYNMVQDVVDTYPTEIGYNATHYTENSCTEMYTGLLEKKASIKTVEDIKNFIDGFNKPTSGGNNGGNDGGFGGGLGGGVVGGGTLAFEQELVEQAAPVKPESIEIPEMEFTDVAKDYWGFDAIYSLAEEDVISGYEDGTFRPEEKVTRAEFVKMMVLALDIPMEYDAEDECFADVTEGDWYFNYCMAAKKHGLIEGSDNMFLPNDCITREDMAVIIYRSLGIKAEENLNETAFADVAEIANYAYAPVLTLYQKGFVNGMEDGTFCPKNPATRAEAATMIVNMMEKGDVV